STATNDRRVPMSAKKTAAKKAASGDGPSKQLIASNKRARHDYFIDQTWEAGIVLTGTEVKSLRERGASLIDGYCYVEGGEVWMDNAHIAPYVKGTWTNHAARRKRKLLLHKVEIAKLASRSREKGYTIVPMEMYFLGSHAKVVIGLGRGKKEWDKRQTLREKQDLREAQRAMRRRELASRAGCSGGEALPGETGQGLPDRGDPPLIRLSDPHTHEQAPTRIPARPLPSALRRRASARRRLVQALPVLGQGMVEAALRPVLEHAGEHRQGRGGGGVLEARLLGGEVQLLLGGHERPLPLQHLGVAGAAHGAHHGG